MKFRVRGLIGSGSLIFSITTHMLTAYGTKEQPYVVVIYGLL